MATNFTTTFLLILGCLMVVMSAGVMVFITSRAQRLSRRIAGMTFFAALGLQTLDDAINYLFFSDPNEFATVQGSWHGVLLGSIGAIALFFWAIFLAIDNTGVDGEQ